jgi:Ca-activated chloride channel homolog
VTRSLAAAALAACLAVPATAQSPSPPPAQQPKPFTFEVQVEVVSLTAVVFDKAGRFVRGLGPSDIEVYEDGVRQEVALFQEATGGEEKIPLSVVLVLDASGSMRRDLHFLQEAATTFVNKLQDVDQALVVQFNETIKGSAEFTTDAERLEQFVEALQAWGGTSLYDAVHYSLGRIRNQPGRKALIIFSDGDDTTSRMKEQEVLDYARAVEATVYGVGIGDAARGFLKRIASETGGETFFPEKVGDLIRAFAAISEELHNHYLLAYSPTRPADGSWRAIQLKLNRKDVQVRVRKGYFAVKRARPPGR